MATTTRANLRKALNGKIQTFPNDGHIPIVVTDDIG